MRAIWKWLMRVALPTTSVVEEAPAARGALALKTATALSAIRGLDYTILFARNPAAMRQFYKDVMEFPVYRDVHPRWIEYRVGQNLLVVTERGGLFNDPPPPAGALSVQLAFRVSPAEVQACAEALKAKGVALHSGPTDNPFGHRALFFRDPDGNVLEIYAEV